MLAVPTRVQTSAEGLIASIVKWYCLNDPIQFLLAPVQQGSDLHFVQVRVEQHAKAISFYPDDDPLDDDRFIVQDQGVIDMRRFRGMEARADFGNVQHMCSRLDSMKSDCHWQKHL